MRLHPFTGRSALAIWLATGIAVASTFLIVTPAQALPDQRIGYGFEAGSGTAVADSSSNNTPATATAPTWTTNGRFGNGITFNGSTTRVRSNAEITLNAAFTLEAYVLNPTNQDYETVLTVGTNRDVYLNNGVLNLWTGSANLAFGPALAAGTWQHVAIVSDGASVRAYVNGVQRGTTQNTAVGNTTGSLQVGSWIEESGANTDFFSGNLDEVRAYNRALSAAEIKTVRTSALS